MQVKELIAEFAVKEIIPVQLEEVQAALRAKGVDDEIYYFYDTTLPPNIFSGFIHSEEIPWGDDTKIITTITYAKMGSEMERLVCCKEMLHILDPDHLKTRTLRDVDRLISEIVLPPELQNFANNGGHTNLDIISMTHAIAILMPLAVVDLLRPPFKAGKISIEEIAARADLPIFAVSFAMDDTWPKFHANLVHRFPQIVA